ncbi:hypothetical protein [Caenispirillum salinarum]|uniref:hypothetical protein n=1 Tax=Caenispirillum salinarum TaxID=859058 RepID=UPI0012675E35|nr:hypothetical protein [Caenispirillum salinarum]
MQLLTGFLGMALSDEQGIVGRSPMYDEVEPHEQVLIIKRLLRLAHRVLARQLATEPELVDRIREALDVALQQPMTLADPAALLEWQRLLDFPPTLVRRAITMQGRAMDLMRAVSPLLSARPCSEAERQRLWQLAVKGCLHAKSRLPLE